MRISDWSSDVCSSDLMAVAETIDERALNTRENMNVYQKTENQNLAINAAKAIGCQVTNIGAADLIEARVHQLFACDASIPIPRTLTIVVCVFSPFRSEERRVGKECVRTFKFRW